MRKIKTKSTKDRIINAAWELFEKQGYEKTTINEIIEVSETSRGAFYHHFRGKEDLMFCLAYFFDLDYDKWLEELDQDMTTLEKLLAFDSFVLKNLEDSPYRSFLPELYGMQVKTEGVRHILNPERRYYQLVMSFMKEGQERGEIKKDQTYQQLTEWYAIIERGFTYDWCLNQFRYSLHQYGQNMMRLYLDSLK